jgi:hypothetical protein
MLLYAIYYHCLSLLQALAQFVSETSDLSEDVLSVWSSTMKRARQTSKGIKCTRYVEWRALREIEASHTVLFTVPIYA